MTEEAEPAERILWSGGPALRNWWPALGLGAACLASTAALFVYGAGAASLAGPVLGAALALSAFLRSRTRRYILTSQRIIAVAGLLSRRRSEVELGDIRHLSLAQSLGQRLLGVGDILIESSGGPEVEVRVAAVARPAELLERIRQARLARARPASPPASDES
ncbi:MAG: PH domain-containing protein [Elusimicrobia bacterium]|nr:PH domain-containing protein [Elusimicrobiota bacterium]